MELDLERVRAACSVFGAAASEAAGADASTVEAGVAAALPGGSVTAGAVSGAGAAVTDALALLSRRAQVLRDTGQAVAERLDATDRDFAHALDAAVPR